MTTERPWAPVPLVRGARGAVVAPHHLASEAGLSVLRAGGSAVDAAIATNAALGVVMPNGCGIGGDAFWLTWDAATGRQSALNGSGRAGSHADAGWLRATGLTELPRRGPLTITVPGAVRSWGDAHAAAGRLSRDAILAPAIELARNGFPAWDGFIDSVERTARSSRTTSGPSAGFFAVYRPHGRPWRPGEIVRLPALASTLETLARDGFDAFYEGDLGERQARTLADVGALVTAADLRAHTSTPDARRSGSTTGASGSRPTRRTAPGSSRSSCSRSSRSSRPPVARRSGRPASPTRAGSISASRRPSSRWPTATRS